MPPMLSSPVFFPHLNLRRARLTANQLLHVRTESGTVSVVFDVGEVRHCTLTGKAYEAVDSNFAAPDRCFGRHRTPLADITTLESESKDRCLPMLGAGAADPKLWVSAVRTAGVILEERLRSVGRITDGQVIGRDLVNRVFGMRGTLAAKFANEAERESHRDV